MSVHFATFRKLDQANGISQQLGHTNDNLTQTAITMLPCGQQKRSTSKIAIKYVINRLLHVFCHLITHISP